MFLVPNLRISTLNNDDIRILSHQLFGNGDRLDSAAAIGRLTGKSISVKELAKESGLDPNRAQERIAHFHRIGFLVPDFDSSSRQKDYRPIETGFWVSCARLLDEFRERDNLS